MEKNVNAGENEGIRVSQSLCHYDPGAACAKASTPNNVSKCLAYCSQCSPENIYIINN